jgi:hypothetical protein
MIELDADEARRALSWARGCDGESYIDEDDWPLIVKLAALDGKDPETYVPYYGSERGKA